MLMGHSIEWSLPLPRLPCGRVRGGAPDQPACGLTEKYLRWKAVGHRLPDEIAARKKQPYRAPIVGAFVGADAPAYVREPLTSAASRTPACSRRRRSSASCEAGGWRS